MMKTTALLRRSILSRAAFQQTSKRSSFLASCQSSPRANSCHFFSSSPDYANTLDNSWHDSHNIQQPYLNGGNHHASNGSDDHLVIKNLAGQEFAHLDNSHHGVNYNNNNSPLEGPRTSVLMELDDRVGALHDVLKY